MMLCKIALWHLSVCKRKRFGIQKLCNRRIDVELKDDKISKHKMVKMIYSELVYYNYSEEEIAEYIVTREVTEDLSAD